MTERYEDIRRKLEERGYLNGRVERFVLGGSGSARGVGGLAAAGVRAASIGGPILGLLLSGAVVVLNRPILAAADGAVLWGYFSILSAAALFLLSLTVAALMAVVAARRGARAGDSTRASFLVALPALSYFVLLWWAKPASSPFWEDAVLFVGALAATLFVAWLGGLVSLAGIIGRTGEVPDRARRPILVVAGVLTPIAALALAFGTHGRGAGGALANPASDFEPALSRERLVFLGVDGLDSTLVLALEPSGALDDLLARFGRGVVFPLRREPAREPAEVWTTITSGMGLEAHGVGGAGAERLPGVVTPLRPNAGPVPLRALIRFALPTRTVPTTGAFRSVRSLPEIVGLKQPVASVGWWASWPATPSEDGGPRSYVVSDRVLPKLLAQIAGDRDTTPAALFERLRAGFDADRAALQAEFDVRFRGVEDAALERMAWESFLIDGWNARTVGLLLQDDALRALFAYLPGLDILRTRLRGTGTDPLASAPSRRVLEAYVRWLDSILEELLRRHAASGTIVIAGDPGRSAREGSEGFVHVSLPGGRAGCIGEALTDIDVAPLTLALLGFPSSAEMRGKAPSTCLDIARSARIRTYGRKSIPREAAAGSDDPAILERLRSLGYVQ